MKYYHYQCKNIPIFLSVLLYDKDLNLTNMINQKSYSSIIRESLEMLFVIISFYCKLV
jgi:hypothetical protein